MTYLRLIFLLTWTMAISCTNQNQTQKTKNEPPAEELDWATKEYKRELQQTDRKDSIEIFSLYMEELPDDFFENSELKYLRIGCTEMNCLTRLSPKIANFVNLETLILSKTSLKELPKEIGQLKKLKTLRVLAGGQLESLPEEIGELENLELLDVWRNKLKEIPKTIYSLEQLKTLYIGQNQLTKAQIKELETNLPNVRVKIYR